MSTPTPASDRFPESAEPPPGCPAHGLDLGSGVGPGGVRRLFGPEAEKDPYTLYEQLRAEHGNVAPVLVHGDIPAWLVLGHRENLEVVRTPSRFSRDSRRWRELKEGRVPMTSPLLPIVMWQPMCSFVDGEEHERLRGAVTDSMGRIDYRGLRRLIKRFTNRLVDTFCEDGHADAVSQFAERLPMMVMTEILGMGSDYSQRLVDAAGDMVKASETAIASNEYIVGLLQNLVTRSRANPQPDFASWLVTHDAQLNDDECVQHLRLVLIAGYETTANLIANTLLMVLTDPRFRARLSGGHMTLPEAVEQVLWDEPPFTKVYGRYATVDTRIGDQEVKEGDLLVLGLAAANTDPAVRPDPTVPMHGNRSHLAFSGGPHECPGQDIGRAITDAGIDALLIRLPDLELAVPEDQLRRDASLLSNHLQKVPVAFASRKPEPEEAEDPPVRAPLPPETPSLNLAEELAALGDLPAGRRSGGHGSWWSRLSRWWNGR